MAKLFVSEAAGRCADRAVQAFGGRGYMRTQRRRALPARAARRPDLGGHERDPAADHRPRARAPRASRRRSIDRSRGTSAGCCAGVDRGRRRQRPARQLRRAGAAQPRGDRLRRRRCGASTRTAARCSGGRACRRSPTCRSAVDAVVVAIPAAGVPDVIEQAGARGCGGAVVFSAGFAEVASGRRAAGRAGRGGASATRCRCAARTATGSSSMRARATRSGATRSRRTRPGRWRSSRRAATSRSTRSRRAAGCASTR